MAFRTNAHRRFARSIATLAVVAGVTTLATTAQPTAAQEPAPSTNSIDILFEAPNALVDGMDVRLLLGGVDVTNTSCGPLAAASALTPPTRTCSDFPDGNYAVEVRRAATAHGAVVSPSGPTP